MFDVVRIPALKDNYIWLLRQGTSAVVVDPGDAVPVLAVLAELGLSLTAILVTHHHQDHQGGVAHLLTHFPAEVFGPGNESITGITCPLRGGESISPGLPGLTLQVLHVPGHTLGHLAYYCPGLLFCGDTLFCAGCGRLFEGSPAQMFASLQSLAALPEQTKVYCAHEYSEANLHFATLVEPGNGSVQRRLREVSLLRARGEASVPSTIGCEREINPFLRCSEPDIVLSAQKRSIQASDPVTVFATLRAWKDDF